MKTKKFLPIILSTAMLTTTLFTGCGQDVITKVNENGEVASSVELEQVSDENKSLPTYDVNALEQSTTEISLNEVPSYYKSLLNERNIIIYDDIKNAYIDYKSEILLKKACTEEELFKIMTILYIDEPSLFQMKPKYDYYLDSNGYVSKINLYYNISQVEYNQYKNRLDNKLLSVYSTVYQYIKENEIDNILAEKQGITDYDAFCLIKGITDGEMESLKPSHPTDDKVDYSVIAKLNGKDTAFSTAKYNALILRYVGINSSVIIGKLTNDDYSNELQNNSTGLKIENFDDLKTKHTIESDEDGNTKYAVEYNFNDYYAWNIVNINGKWYHYDELLPSYYAQKNSIATADKDGILQSDDESVKQLLLFVSDYTISSSRIFYYSDELLGESPLCVSKSYQGSYRNGFYILPHTENQTKTLLENKIEMMATKNNAQYFQFENEETYQYFLNNLNTMIEAYNQDSLTKIIGYDMIESKDMLFVYISNIKMKK